MVDISRYVTLKDKHRFGWYKVALDTYRAGNGKGTYVDMYLDSTFGWMEEFNRYRGLIPYQFYWVGVIHHTEDSDYNNNCMKLLECKTLQISLEFCKCIIVLSSRLARIVDSKLKSLGFNILVVSLVHPMPIQLKKFDINSYIYNRNSKRAVYHVGSWMRNPFSFYRLNLGTIYSKFILIGDDMSSNLPPTDLENYVLVGKVTSDIGILEVTQECRTNDNIWIKYAHSYYRTKYDIGLNSGKIIVANNNTRNMIL